MPITITREDNNVIIKYDANDEEAAKNLAKELHDELAKTPETLLMDIKDKIITIKCPDVNQTQIDEIIKKYNSNETKRTSNLQISPVEEEDDNTDDTTPIKTGKPITPLKRSQNNEDDPNDETALRISDDLPSDPYPYQHSSQVLRPITALRLDAMGKYYPQEVAATRSKLFTLTTETKQGFLPCLRKMVQEANAARILINPKTEQQEKVPLDILNKAIIALRDPNNKNKFVDEILKEIHPNLSQILNSEFIRNQFGIGYFDFSKQLLSSWVEPGSSPLDRLSWLGLNDSYRQNVSAMGEFMVLFGDYDFDFKDDGSFTLSSTDKPPIVLITGKMDPNTQTYTLELDKNVPADKRAQANIAMSYISMQFRQQNRSNSVKITAEPNADALELLINASELICRGKVHTDMSAVNDIFFAQVEKYPPDEQKQMEQAWHELLLLSTMRSRRNPEVIEHWPPELARTLGLRSILSPHAAVDKQLLRISNDVDNIAKNLGSEITRASPTREALPPAPTRPPLPNHNM